MSSQRFSCTKCGHSFELYPPQTHHNEMSLQRCKGQSEDHNITMTVDCENCHEVSTVYWCNGYHGTFVASTR